MGKVIQLKPAADPDEVLKLAKGEYDDVLVMGYDKDNRLQVRSSLGLTHSDILWMIETFKHRLVRGDYGVY